MVDFICTFCWHNSTSFFNSMINILNFRYANPKTSDYYYYFANWWTQNNSLDCPYDKKIKLPLPYCNTKEINFSQFYYTCYLLKTLLRTQTNLHEFHLYCCDHVCKVNEWSLVYCFHSQFSVSTQIMQGVN